jgi:glycosyltransferase involved in cell wall biosynthesis
MASRPSISVVICAYTEARWRDLVAAAKSARSQTLPPLEVIVVVDHSPRLLERVRTGLPDVVAVANHASAGLSGARNSGVAAARGTVVAFLDDDAVAAPDWLERLTAAYLDERVLGVGGEIEPVWETGRPRWFPVEFGWVVGCTFRGLPERTSVVRNPIGANMSFRRELFEAVGGFHSGFGRVGTRPLGCEETEWCIRAQRRRPDGFMLYEPRARVAHRVTASRVRWRYFTSRCYAEGLSKALVAQVAGKRDALASERSYVARTLPRGVARGLADAGRGDPAGLARAGAIIVGLSVTAAGYLVGRAGRAGTAVAHA